MGIMNGHRYTTTATTTFTTCPLGSIEELTVERRYFGFLNGFGASIMRFNDDMMWELAVLECTSVENDEWSITYDTAITDDVIPHNSECEIASLLNKISNLKMKKA
tara:strand:+ start:418 stop:735 length:318 start_codon:yes stop_codon:yes gene_type:complete